MIEKTLSNKISCNGNIYADDVKEFIKQIEDWCYKNNTIPLKDSKLKLAVLDGGWVNVIRLMNFIKEKAGKDLI